MSYFLAIDLGTTGCRSLIYNSNLEIVSCSYEEYALITPKENYVEQDANVWWEIAFRTMKTAINESMISGKDIDSISISSQGITIVPVNQNFKPIYNALTWLDTRAEHETEIIKQDFGEDIIYAITGKPISALYTLPKLLWIKSNLPQIYEKTYKFLMPMDFLIAKLTDICVTDYSMASGTLFFDLNSFCWNERILDRYKIDINKLPEVVASGTDIGFVLPEIAEKLGLKENCVVAVGAQDQKCAAYGAGLKKDVMTVSLGTAAAITKIIDTPAENDNNIFGWCGYLEKDSFVTEVVINTAGTCLRWVRDTFFKGQDYEIINKEALSANQRGSSLMFFPHLAGASAPNYYPDSTGVFHGINLATTRGDFALSVMEGIAFQIREIFEKISVSNDVNTVVLFGGGVKSDLWPTIIADITGLKICVTKSFEVASAGAAMLAAKAVGHELKPVVIDKEFLPNNTDYYNEKYRKYLTIEKRIWENDVK